MKTQFPLPFILVFLMLWSNFFFAQEQFPASPIGPNHLQKRTSPCMQQEMTDQFYKNFEDARPENNPAYQLLNGPNSQLTNKVCDMNRVIPVVFHIVHLCGPENIDLSQIQNVMSRLNDDYNKLNDYQSHIPPNDPHYNNIANIGLTFKLAEIDPYGNATTGVTRTESYTTFQGTSHEVKIKSLINWDRSRYLNVWIVNSTGGSGYAQFPATVDAPEWAFYDGIVMSHNYFGTIGEAQGNIRPNVFPHEVGHWLNLQHTWGSNYYNGDPNACGDDDAVSDTPNTVGTNYIVCPYDIIDTCPDAGVDNHHNFMDYGCEVMFTEGQKTRMWDCLCSPVSQRDQIGTAASNVDALMSNPNQPKLTTENYIFQESKRNDGSFDNELEISISTGNFVSNLSQDVHYTVTPALPAGLVLQISNVGGNKLLVSLVGSSSTHTNNNDLNDININFNNNAFSGVNAANLFSTSINGLRIDFDDPSSIINHAYNDYYTGDYFSVPKEDYYWMGWFSNYIGFLGVVYNVPEFDMYNESTNPVEVLCMTGTLNIANLPEGTVLNPNLTGFDYQLLGGGAPDAQNPRLWSPTYNAWSGQVGYAGIRFKSSCSADYNYAWIKFYVEPNAELISIIEMVYTDQAGAPVTVGQGNCNAYGDSTFDWIERIELENLDNTSGDDGGYANYKSNIVTIDRDVTSNFTLHQGGTLAYDAHWKIWVDFNNNGTFTDPGERIYYRYDNDPSIHFVSETNYSLVGSNIPVGTYDMRIGISLYHSFNPCEMVQYGEIEDYTLNVIDNTSACSQPVAGSITHTGGSYYGYLYAQAYNGVNHQFQYREIGASNWIGLPATTVYYSSLTNLTSCLEYEAQLKVYCNGGWSAWSGSFLFNTGPDAPPASDITQTGNRYYGYVYTNAYDGLPHQFKYRQRGLSNWIVLPETTLYYDALTGLSSCTEYEVKLRTRCGNAWSAYSESFWFSTNGAQPIIKVFLQGPTDVGTKMMTPALFENGLLPGQTPIDSQLPATPAGQPYNIAPWNYAGTEGANFTNVDYDAIVAENNGLKPIDWVLISFRSETSAATEEHRTAALVLENGKVHFVDECLNLFVNNGYYIVIEHRNHLDVMSPAITTYYDEYITYDFSLQNSFNTGNTGSIEVSPGFWVMIQNDSDANDNVDANDRSEPWNLRNQEGYMGPDANMNGTIDASDRSGAWNNRNNSSQVPD